MAKAKKIETAAERYRRLKEERNSKREPVIFTTETPSGLVCTFSDLDEKMPIFVMAQMPGFTADKAIKSWKEQGVIKGLKNGNGTPSIASPEQIASNIKLGTDTCQMIVSQSIEPKFVWGEPQKDNEICVMDLSSEDRAWLYNFVQTGGNEQATELATFPKGRR